MTETKKNNCSCCKYNNNGVCECEQSDNRFDNVADTLTCKWWEAKNVYSKRESNIDK